MFRSKNMLLVISLLAVLSMIVSACAPAATATPAAFRRTHQTPFTNNLLLPRFETDGEVLPLRRPTRMFSWSSLPLRSDPRADTIMAGGPAKEGRPLRAADRRPWRRPRTAPVRRGLRGPRGAWRPPRVGPRPSASTERLRQRPPPRSRPPRFSP